MPTHQHIVCVMFSNTVFHIHSLPPQYDGQLASQAVGMKLLFISNIIFISPGAVCLSDTNPHNGKIVLAPTWPDDFTCVVHRYY